MSQPVKYIEGKTLAVLKQNMQLSPSTLHKIMNPFCGVCLAGKKKANDA